LQKANSITEWSLGEIQQYSDYNLVPEEDRVIEAMEYSREINSGSKDERKGQGKQGSEMGFRIQFPLTGMSTPINILQRLVRFNQPHLGSLARKLLSGKQANKNFFVSLSQEGCCHTEECGCTLELRGISKKTEGFSFVSRKGTLSEKYVEAIRQINLHKEVGDGYSPAQEGSRAIVRAHKVNVQGEIPTLVSYCLKVLSKRQKVGVGI